MTYSKWVYASLLAASISLSGLTAEAKKSSSKTGKKVATEYMKASSKAKKKQARVSKKSKKNLAASQKKQNREVASTQPKKNLKNKAKKNKNKTY